MIRYPGRGRVIMQRFKSTGKGRGGVFSAVLAAFFTALFLKAFVFDFMIVDGRSMEPALKSGAVVVMFRLAYGIRIPFAAPVDGTADADPSGGRYLIRWREPKAGEVVVFWTPLGELAVKRIAVLPAFDGGGRYLLLGDNSVESYDSRAYGPVRSDAIVGQVLGKR